MILQFTRCIILPCKWLSHIKSLWIFPNLILTLLGIEKNKDMKCKLDCLKGYSLKDLIFTPLTRIASSRRPIFFWISPLLNPTQCRNYELLPKAKQDMRREDSQHCIWIKKSICPPSTPPQQESTHFSTSLFSIQPLAWSNQQSISSISFDSHHPHRKQKCHLQTINEIYSTHSPSTFYIKTSNETLLCSGNKATENFHNLAAL